MIYFTSDHHFGHRNISAYTNRPFDSVESMDEALIAAWNRTVSPSDMVYHLGDFTLGGQEVARKYFARLNGNISVVPGGHDHRWTKTGWKGWGSGYTSASGLPVLILPSLYTLKAEGHIIVLCHWAMRVFDRSHYGSLHLYGHSHGKLPGTNHSMDVGVDAVGYEPISLGEVIKRLA